MGWLLSMKIAVEISWREYDARLVLVVSNALQRKRDEVFHVCFEFVRKAIPGDKLMEWFVLGVNGTSFGNMRIKENR